MAAFVAPGAARAIDNPCDDRFVSVDATRFFLVPSGSDDTDNLDCALQEAARQGVLEVRLDRGDYRLSRKISVADFNGTLLGNTTSSTRLRAEDGAYDCPGFGDQSAALEFQGGRSAARFLSIDAPAPCGSGVGSFAIIRYTSLARDCSQRTVFGEVDRVALSTTPTFDRSHGAIVVSQHSTCPLTPLANGTFKLNRSSVSGFTFGVALSLGAGSQVDINFNEFVNNEASVSIADANQSTSVFNNIFDYAQRPAAIGFSAGIFVTTTRANAPNRNRLLVHRNIFLDQGADEFQSSLYIGLPEKRQQLSLAVTGNEFELGDENGSVGVEVGDVDGGYVAENRFAGDAFSAIYIDSFRDDTPAVAWAIVANHFSEVLPSQGDIWLGTFTSNALVGFQDALVLDDGTSNYVDGRNLIFADDSPVVLDGNGFLVPRASGNGRPAAAARQPGRHDAAQEAAGAIRATVAPPRQRAISGS